jgi:hypothetical protein
LNTISVRSPINSAIEQVVPKIETETGMESNGTHGPNFNETFQLIQNIMIQKRETRTNDTEHGPTYYSEFGPRIPTLTAQQFEPMKGPYSDDMLPFKKRYVVRVDSYSPAAPMSMQFSKNCDQMQRHKSKKRKIAK